jgi:putative oxidoreductase
MSNLTIRLNNDLAPANTHYRIVGGLTGLGLVMACFALFTTSRDVLPLGAGLFTISFLAISTIVWIVVVPRAFVPGFTVGLLTMLMGWRIAGLLDIELVAWALLPAFLSAIVVFFIARRDDLKRSVPAMDATQWGLTFLRLYVGFDLVPHFTEKLFAGSAARLEDISTFQSMGLSGAFWFVLVAGLCELGIAIGIGLGFLTRLAGACAALYFLIATYLGGHFSNGFIWASEGGGWEYPALMIALFLVFSAIGATRFSLDGMMRSVRR